MECVHFVLLGLCCDYLLKEDANLKSDPMITYSKDTIAICVSKGSFAGRDRTWDPPAANNLRLIENVVVNLVEVSLSLDVFLKYNYHAINIAEHQSQKILI